MGIYRRPAFQVINKKCFFLLILTILTHVCVAQSKTDSVRYYIDKLNWKSFVASYEYVPNLVLLNDAKRIVSLRDKKKVPKLVSALCTEQKTVVIHIILTQLLEPEKTTIKLSYIYAKGASIKEVRYTYNGLSWFYNVKTGADSICNKGISYTKKYWKSFLKHKH